MLDFAGVPAGTSKKKYLVRSVVGWLLNSSNEIRIQRVSLPSLEMAKTFMKILWKKTRKLVFSEIQLAQMRKRNMLGFARSTSQGDFLAHKHRLPLLQEKRRALMRRSRRSRRSASKSRHSREFQPPLPDSGKKYCTSSIIHQEHHPSFIIIIIPYSWVILSYTNFYQDYQDFRHLQMSRLNSSTFSDQEYIKQPPSDLYKTSPSLRLSSGTNDPTGIR